MDATTPNCVLSPVISQPDTVTITDSDFDCIQVLSILLGATRMGRSHSLRPRVTTLNLVYLPVTCNGYLNSIVPPLGSLTLQSANQLVEYILLLGTSCVAESFPVETRIIHSLTSPIPSRLLTSDHLKEVNRSLTPWHWCTDIGETSSHPHPNYGFASLLFCPRRGGSRCCVPSSRTHAVQF
jgi:hypothetical protein